MSWQGIPLDSDIIMKIRFMLFLIKKPYCLYTILLLFKIIRINLIKDNKY